MTCVTYRPEHLHTSMGLRVLTPSQVYLESKCWDQASSNLDLGVTMMNRCPSQHTCNTGVRNKLFCVQRGLGLSVTLKQLSVASVVSNSLQPHGLQHTRLPCPSISSRVCSDSHPLSQWCSLTISSSAALFSFCFQSFPAWGSFPQHNHTHFWQL